jgi:hypothetical protein
VVYDPLTVCDFAEKTARLAVSLRRIADRVKRHPGPWGKLKSLLRKPRGTPTADSSTSPETLVGYNGRVGVRTGPSTFTANDFYSAYASLAGPNSGFSVTGFDVVFGISNSDPNAIEFLCLETQLISAPMLAESGTIGLVMLAMGFLFPACMRFPHAFRRTSG